MNQIKTTERGTWAVFADWLGRERIVFESASVFQCIAYRARIGA
jgi:hypothetical protein